MHMLISIHRPPAEDNFVRNMEV